VRSLETVQQHYSNKINSTSFYNTYEVALQIQKTIFSLRDALFVQVRKCPERSKDKRSNLAGGFNLNTVNSTKPLSSQCYVPHSFTAGSSSTALPKVKPGKRRVTTELTETEQFTPTLPFRCSWYLLSYHSCSGKVLLLLHR